MAKTVDQFSTLENFRTRYNDLANDVGDISGLRTDVKGNLIDAINSVEDKTFFYQEFLYTATSSQTAFTGDDAFSNSLSFRQNRIQVYKNGTLLRVGDDYTITGQQSDGTFNQVTLTSGASTGDKIAIHAFTGSFLTVQAGGVGGSSLFTETANNTPSVTSLDTGVNIQLEGVTKVDGNLTVDTGHTLSAPTITDGTGTFTGGNGTGWTSITSTSFAGNLTGNSTGTHTGPIQTSSGNLQVTAASYITEFRGGGGTDGQIKLNCSMNSHGQTIKPQPHSANVTNELLLPAGGNQELVGTTATQTLTNKTITGTFNGDVKNGSSTVLDVSTGALTGTVSGIANHNLSGLADVNYTTTPSNGQILVWDNANGYWEPATQNDSDSVAEGSNNLYFTDERVDDRVSNLLVAGTGISLSYNDSANSLTITGSAQYGDEDVLDFLGGGGLVGGNGIDLSYDDAANTLTIHSDIEGGSGLLAVTEATGLNTVNVGQGKGIKVNADDVALDYEVTNSAPGSVGSTPDGHLWFVI